MESKRWGTSALSTLSLVTGCVSVLFGCLIPLPVIAIVSALMVLKESEVTKERRMALAGLILGCLMGCMWGAYFYLGSSMGLKS